MKWNHLWEHFGIQKKMGLYILLISIMPISILIIARSYALEEAIYEEKKVNLRYQTDLVISQINIYYSDFLSGKYETTDEAKIAASTMVMNFRYGNNLSNYFWIQARYENNTPYMVMHPYFPGLNGSATTEVDAAAFQTMVEVLAEIQELDEDPNEGFIEYEWPAQYNDTQRYITKLSYIVLFEEWDWILGTGFYIDDIEETVQKNLTTDLLLMFLTYGILGLIIFSLIFKELKEKEQFEKSLKLSNVQSQHDIEERKKIEKQLKETQGKLLQSQKMDALGRFAGGIAHDFNNLLTVITGLSDMMIEGLTDNQQDLKEDLQEILNAGNKAAALTRQILTFSRKQIIQPKVININDLIKTMIKMLKRLMGENISIIMHLAPDLGNILVDIDQMGQVIMNLLVNASDAMPNGGSVIIETKNIYLSTEMIRGNNTPGDYIQISITDTGTGMDDHQLSHLFEPFYTTKEQGKGTGLGLSTVYGIVQQCKGEISVYSHLETGTTFNVYFPQISLPASKITAQNSIPPAILKGHETILVVEDESYLRKFILRVLTSSGYTVLDSEDPLHALDISRNYSKEIHMLLTDIIMPKMAGNELADIITQERSSILVLFMSGYSEKAIDIQGVLKEGLNFLSKPFSPSDLLWKIRAIFSDNEN
jgi:signal transduction histidine kinase/ActR/RegA family two-component response regulator